MDRVGADSHNDELLVPEMFIAARAMRASMDILRPLLAESDVPSTGKVVIDTVAGDLHDIGKNLAVMMLEGGGFEVIDIGVDAALDKIVEVVKAENPNLIGLSAPLTTTMPAMRHTINALAEAGVRGNVKVMIGGTSVTQAIGADFGADGYAPGAAAAVGLARSLF